MINGNVKVVGNGAKPGAGAALIKLPTRANNSVSRVPVVTTLTVLAPGWTVARGSVQFGIQYTI